MRRIALGANAVNGEENGRHIGSAGISAGTWGRALIGRDARAPNELRTEYARSLRYNHFASRAPLARSQFTSASRPVSMPALQAACNGVSLA